MERYCNGQHGFIPFIEDTTKTTHTSFSGLSTFCKIGRTMA